MGTQGDVDADLFPYLLLLNPTDIFCLVNITYFADQQLSDMFAYALDPEHKHSIQSVFVHDMAVNPWNEPSEETYIDGRKAWFVIGSSKKGAMGPTLGSFKTKESAESFAEEFGGE